MRQIVLMLLLLHTPILHLQTRPPVPPKNGAVLVSAYMGALHNKNTVQVGQSFQLHIIGVFSDESTETIDNRYVVWDITPRDYVTITQTGVVTGIRPGIVNVTARMMIAGREKPVFSNWWTVTVTDYKGKFRYDDEEE